MRRLLFLFAIVPLVAGAGPVAPTGEVLRLKGHTDAVLCVAFSPDGKLLASASADGTAILWDAATGQKRVTLEGHAKAVGAVGFSADGTRVITGSLDETARVWDARTGDLVALLNRGHSLHVHAAALSPDGKFAVTGSCDHTVALWDVAGEKVLRTFPRRGDTWAVGFLPGGKTFYSCHSDTRNGGRADVPGRNVVFYDVATAAVARDVELPPVQDACVVDGGKRLMALCENRWWGVDVESGKAALLPRQPAPGVTQYAVTADGKFALVSPVDGTGRFRLELIDLATGQRAVEFPLQHEVIRGIAVSPDGKRGAIGGGGAPREVSWSTDWQRAADPDVRIFSLAPDAGAAAAAARFAADPPTRTPFVYTGVVATTPDGKRLLTASGEKAVWWDVASGREVSRVQIGRSIDDAAGSADGARLAVAADRREVRLYDGGKEVAKIDGFAGPVNDMAFLPDGKSLLIAAGEAPGLSAVAPAAELRRWDAASGKELNRYAVVAAGVRRAAVSPDGRWAVSASADGARLTAQAWDVASGRPLWTFAADASAATVVANALVVSADGRRVAVGGADQAYVLDAANGKVIATLDRHKRAVTKIAFDPDGKRIWTLAQLDAVRSWDVASGKLLATFDVSLPGSMTAAFLFERDRRTLYDGSGKSPREYDLGK